MSKQEERRPSIRFKGYTEPWEQRKLGEVAEFTKGRGYSKGDIESSGVPIILYGRLYTDYQTIIGDVDTYVTMKSHSVLSEGNEIIVPSSGESSEEISRASVVAKKGVILGGDLNIIRLTKKFSSVFVAITLSNGSQQKELSKRAQGKSVVHLHNSDLKEVNLFFPTLPEQAAIGSFFQELDQLITLQQRELELMKEGKKTLLSKMFPKDGENFPEIRFPGFTNAWEQRKLGEVSEKVKEKNSDNLYSSVLTNSAEFGIIPQRDFFDKDIANEKSLNGYYIVKQDDFVYNPRISNHAPVGPIKRNRLNEVGVMSPLYYVFRTHNIENSYLATYFDATYWHKFMKLNGDSGARADRFAIKDSLFIEMPIPFPPLPEQTAIGSFFKELDQLITLQQRELEILKIMKSTLLKAMFA
ncbi:restriction endonuclease subunit S [Streptococcus infantis]|uniref:restriction endonuclease subunit S n=1 Tax=Streptococcus infantis TaxID=68892 RepID=UPI0039C22744